MEQKKETHIKVNGSNCLKALLLDPQVTTDIAKCHGSLEKVIYQVVQDISKRGDDEVTLQVNKGVGHVREILLLFKQEGEHDIAKEKASAP